MAVNNKNEIVVTDFHNHSVKVSLASAGSASGAPSAVPSAMPVPLCHWPRASSH